MATRSACAPEPAKIQIGGGTHRIDGFFNIDAVPPADLLWDIREGIPLQDDSASEIFSEHFLEHIDYPRSAKHYAREAYRVLVPGGRIINPKYTPHLWAYDHDKLVQLFTEASFTTVEPWTFDPAMANPKRLWGSVYVIATK